MSPSSNALSCMICIANDNHKLYFEDKESSCKEALVAEMWLVRAAPVNWYSCVLCHLSQQEAAAHLLPCSPCSPSLHNPSQAQIQQESIIPGAQPCICLQLTKQLALPLKSIYRLNNLRLATLGTSSEEQGLH